MEFEKISSPSLRELFVDQLENMILSGKLKIGEKLPLRGFTIKKPFFSSSAIPLFTTARLTCII